MQSPPCCWDMDVGHMFRSFQFAGSTFAKWRHHIRCQISTCCMKYWSDCTSCDVTWNDVIWCYKSPLLLADIPDAQCWFLLGYCDMPSRWTPGWYSVSSSDWTVLEIKSEGGTHSGAVHTHTERQAQTCTDIHLHIQTQHTHTRHTHQANWGQQNMTSRKSEENWV